MTLIVWVSVLVALASIVVPLVRRGGIGGLDAASVAALAVMADLIALLGCLLVSLATWIRGGGVRLPLVAAGISLVALVWCIARHSHVTRPREVPRHVNAAWNIPTRPTSQMMVNLLDVQQEAQATRLEVITTDGHFTSLTTGCEPARCRSLIGHRAVLLLDVTDPSRVVDLFDLGAVDEGEITRPPSATPGAGLPGDELGRGPSAAAS